MPSKTRIVVAVATVGVVLAGGGIALAATTGGTAAPTAGSSSSGSTSSKSAAHRGHDRGFPGLALHAQWVTRDKKTGGFTTHDAIRGAVTSVSATSIAVKAADGVTATFSVTSTTKVRIKGAAGQISSVKSGDSVIVVGTGTGTFVATGIVEPKVRTKGTTPTPGAVQPTAAQTS